MNNYIAIENLAEVFSGKKRRPAITLWNRLEGRPRTHDFERALRAEIRDPLWMLTKQWQMGEFEGDDAGSPVFAKVRIDTTELTKYQAASHPPEAFDDDVPLEAKVEQRPIPWSAAGKPMALDLRLAMGRRWLKLVRAMVPAIELAANPGIEEKFIAAFGFEAPDPTDPADAPLAAHREAWQAVAAMAGRSMDGRALYEYLAADPSSHHAHDLVVLVDPAASEGPIETAEAEFVSWYESLVYQPGPETGNAWLPERLEYAFSASAPRDGGEQHLVADEYFHGHLDWYNLDIHPSGQGLGEVDGAPPPGDVEASHTASFIPVPIDFDGMPNTRWWTFEEGRTNFGDIDPETTELDKLLLMEFALVYGNDWFLLPFTVPAGTIAKVRGLTVTNVFGERLWIEAAGRGSDEDWQRWSMYNLAVRGSDDVPADLSLVIVPSVSKIQQGEPLETVQLVRDEMANQVWGIETRIPLATGESKSGRSAAFDTRRYHRRLIEENIPPEPPPPPLDNDAAIRYQLMSGVPENWIPLIPVHVPNDNREIQLRRGVMLRIVEDDPDPPVRIEPRTHLLRHGLDRQPLSGYDLHEEEVPRAGIRVSQSFQRTRWYDGQVFLWLGAHKETGRGEPSSGLAFDRIRPKRRG